MSAGGVVNHFSRAAAGLPNGGIAQGSLFDIDGNIGAIIGVTRSLAFK